LREKISDIYAGVNFFQGAPTGSQVEGLNKLGRDMSDGNKKLEEHKKTYRPKVKEAYKYLHKHEPY
jgi:hypothetical protein